MKGIVILDDIIDIVNDVASQDIQNLGAVQALHARIWRSALVEWCGSRPVPWPCFSPAEC